MAHSRFRAMPRQHGQATRSQSNSVARRLFGWETPSRAFVCTVPARWTSRPISRRGLIQTRFVARVGCGMPRQHFRRIGFPPCQAIDQGTTLHLDIAGSLAQNFLAPTTAQPGTAGKSFQEEKKKEKRVQFARIAQSITSAASQHYSEERGSKGANAESTTVLDCSCSNYNHRTGQDKLGTRQGRDGQEYHRRERSPRQGSTRVDLANNLPCPHCPPGSYQDNRNKVLQQGWPPCLVVFIFVSLHCSANKPRVLDTAHSIQQSLLLIHPSQVPDSRTCIALSSPSTSASASLFPSYCTHRYLCHRSPRISVSVFFLFPSF